MPQHHASPARGRYHHLRAQSAGWRSLYGKLLASYEIQTLGLGPQALPAILDGLSQFGELTPDTIRDLNGKVVTNLSALLESPPAGGFTARSLAVQASIPSIFDPIIKAKDEVFAMRRIRAGKFLDDAIQQAGANPNPDVIKAVYSSIAGNIASNAPPSTSGQNAAKGWLG